MTEVDRRPEPDKPQPFRESGQPPGGFRAWWRESRLHKLISRQSPVNTPTPHSPDEPSREQVPGEEVHQVFDKEPVASFTSHKNALN